jgi:hypothetical protein
MRSTLEKGFRREDILALYRFIDWLLQLPDFLEKEFRSDIVKNEEQLMPYVTSFERFAREEGRNEGRQEGQAEGASAGSEMVKETLLVRFGAIDPEAVARINAQGDVAKLRALHHLALISKDMGDFLRGSAIS